MALVGEARAGRDVPGGVAPGEEAARGTGTFMRSQIPLSGLPGYRTA